MNSTKTMDREKRFVLEDATGLQTYYYISPSVSPIVPGGRFPEVRGISRPSLPQGNGTFFNSSLVGLLASAAGGEETEGHARFVAAYTSILADALGLRDRKTIGGLERGALLHDIGKAGVPVAILNKPGPLTAVEREIVREHPVLGYRMIEGLGFLEEAGEIVLGHHERFDGTRLSRAGSPDKASRSRPGSSPWPTLWMRSPPTGLIAGGDVSRRRSGRSLG